MINKFSLSILCILGLVAISMTGIACSQRSNPYNLQYGHPGYQGYPGFPDSPGTNPYRQACNDNDPNCNTDDYDYDNDDDHDDNYEECNHNDPDFQNPNCSFWSDSGATAALTNTNSFENFADLMDLNTDHIDNIQFNLSVANVGSNEKPLYGGVLNVGFYNEADDEINEVQGEATLDASQVPYNHWVLHGNKHYIKLFFEVQGGAFIVVAYPSGDNHLLEGDIYFKEFNNKLCAVSNTWPWYGCGPADFYSGSGNHCWNLPYADNHFDSYSFNVHDCRAFLVDKDRDNGKHARVDTSSSIHPGTTTYGNYRSIGKFKYLVPEDAGITLPYSR